MKIESAIRARTAPKETLLALTPWPSCLEEAIIRLGAQLEFAAESLQHRDYRVTRQRTGTRILGARNVDQAHGGLSEGAAEEDFVSVAARSGVGDDADGGALQAEAGQADGDGDVQILGEMAGRPGRRGLPEHGRPAGTPRG